MKKIVKCSEDSALQFGYCKPMRFSQVTHAFHYPIPIVLHPPCHSCLRSPILARPPHHPSPMFLTLLCLPHCPSPARICFNVPHPCSSPSHIQPNTLACISPWVPDVQRQVAHAPVRCVSCKNPPVRASGSQTTNGAMELTPNHHPSPARITPSITCLHPP